ncbi:MAG: hypothetical protein WA632_09140 [Gallionella sp.]
MLSKVPEVTSYFWIIKILCTTVGETASDFMNVNLGLGLTGTSIAMGICLVTVLVFQFRAKQYIPGIYWLAVVLISIFGTLITDNLTHPLGASLGDYLSQWQANGGHGLGTATTSAAFTIAIFAVVVFLTKTHRDFIAATSVPDEDGVKRSGVMWQVFVVLTVLVFASDSGYYLRSSREQLTATTMARPASPLGDLSVFRKITEDTLGFVRSGDMSNAKLRVGNLEFAWDNAEAQLRSMNKEKWSMVDDSIDAVLRDLRAVRQDPAACAKSLEALTVILDSLDKR